MSQGAFKLVSEFDPKGDQPKSIDALTSGIDRGDPCQVLLGVTGSGKTFSMANVIARVGKPALVISHNKTLAAQLYEEFRELFPENAVCYFVSYYDYYQPEAYIPQRDIYIEKDASRNDDLDRLRLAATSRYDGSQNPKIYPILQLFLRRYRSKRSGRHCFVMASAWASRQDLMFPWWPESKTSGTSRSCQTRGRV